MILPTDIFAIPGPRWFTVPAGRDFLDDLAKGLSAALGARLSEAQVLTPTRRGARAMARAFSALAGDGALLLPQIRAIGDLDEGEPPFDLDALALDLPPALSPLRRRFELARLVSAHHDSALSARRALELADSLAGFFDSLALEEIDATDKLDALVQGVGEAQYVLESWAEHWQVSARFLAIAVKSWPEKLHDLGLMDPSQRQVALIRRLIDQWTEHPPEMPLVLAGTTGSAPSMADLAGLVARAPRGAVLLPGLDLSLADEAWAQIGDSHPQNTMKRALERNGVGREQVRIWPAAARTQRAPEARRRLLNEALRPAEATRDWLAQIAILRSGAQGDVLAEGLQGLNLIETGRDEEAATVIALLMRETLEMPGKVAALITPDITLARRVTARLSRWGLQPDSSAGEPLAHTPVGRYLSDLLALVQDPADPVRLLGLFNNPLCRFSGHAGLAGLERRALRGATPNGPDDVMAVLEACEKRDEEAIRLWTDYLALILPEAQADYIDFGAGLHRFIALAEAMAREDGQVLWAGAPGAQASALLAELIREGQGFALRDLADLAHILGQMLQQTKMRTGGNTHPRLRILGAIEARLVSADRLILAGLEEGVWPQAPELDPFLSRPMRQRLGLPSPERRTGLSAHDFVQAACAPEAWLITRHRREGQPQVASRWLWRLETLCKGAGLDLPTRPEILDWARALDAGLAKRPDRLRPAARPDPKPPLEVRPRRMPVTEVETFVRDPYAVYARRILALRTLDRPNEPVEARQRGTAIHRSLERFVVENLPLGEAGIEQLTEVLDAELAATRLSPAQMALQRPLLPGLAREYVDFEQKRRAHRPRIWVEQSGELSLSTAAGPFLLTARADRIEVRDEAIDILDFKTGQLPAVKEVMAGFYPQLTLTAAIVRGGGFAGLPDRPMGELVYVRVTPDSAKPRNAIERQAIADEAADAALTSLQRRLDAYADANKGYVSWFAPKFLKTRGGDYDHLARLYEWHVLGDEEAGADAEDADA
ncbi:double-strand break repair protein AddB [Asticcacaulis sp. EMRT-3]|uniref:double-strand break repair protein AddB n=1 Tax=Asticcacaulis sp. EMRT-3 TaxID=3040349 RepID=UPI0024AF7E6F|nr:double-strand break repair protein AddB [Asticcacaulis sp. EMRT-3]MDI7775889.1 double-strand break repair protein AddB [Asticcacaulis sp. EMRT-3]